ncbi:hypothetical protein SPONN_2740 [uncultured Candidatus Thioglobus sp.]|nr:hypothetical protein SPONN_2740 [uncultured Candidatus Thioglobus sp.]
MARKYNKRKKTLTALLMPFTKWLLGLLILAGLAWGFYQANLISFFKAEIEWQIDKNLPIEQEKFKKSVQSLTQYQHQLDKNKISQQLKKQPWVEAVHIDQEFFGTTKIKVSAKKVAMRWKNTACKTDDKITCSGYISTNGELFIPKKMPEFNVPLARSKSNKDTISELYQDYQHYQRQAGKMQIKVFSKTHIDQLIFKPNIKVNLGYRQKKQRLIRFLKAYKKLRQKVARKKLDKATFDMRYPKGFSLKY